MCNREFRVLSLDGGGIRALVSLMFLDQLMRGLANDAVIPKPCEYFDLIVGTSTGGLLAIMLGVLQMSVQECIAAYTELATTIFPPRKRPRFRLRLSMTQFLKVQPKYDANVFEMALKTFLTKRGYNPEALLLDPGNTDPKCKV